MARRFGRFAGEPDEFRRTPSALAAAETVAFTLAAPLIGYTINHGDPFLLRSSFHWLALAPLLAGLRYGFAHGFGSALALILGLSAAWRWHLLGITRFPATFSVGLLVTGMLAGEFCDAWTRRLTRLGAVTRYQQMRLSEFTRAYHLLKVSHDRIEQVFAGSTQNLREAIMTMRRTLFAGRQERPPLFGLEKLIVGVFANHGWVQVASLYAINESGQLTGPSLADVGDGVVVGGDDPLVQEALHTRNLVSVRPEAAAQRESVLLAAIPLVDVYGRVWAILAVRSMLFIAFHDENLQLLSILAGNMADILAAGPGLSSSRNLSVKEFSAQLARGILDRRRFDLPVALLGLVAPDEATRQTLTDLVVGQRRGLDQVLLVEEAQRSALLLLMPLTEERGIEGYLGRLSENLKRKTGRALSALAIDVHTRLVGPKDEAEAVLAEMCSRCGIHETEIAHRIDA